MSTETLTPNVAEKPSTLPSGMDPSSFASKSSEDKTQGAVKIRAKDVCVY